MPRRIATNTAVEREELLAFVRPRHRMVLITTRKDGSPQASPVTGGVDAEGRVVIATYPQRAKARNARRAQHAGVLVLSEDFDDSWVQLSGPAEVLDAPDALDEFVEYYRSIAGEHPDWSEYRQAMIDQGKCLVRITPEQWGPVATGGFPAESA